MRYVAIILLSASPAFASDPVYVYPQTVRQGPVVVQPYPTVVQPGPRIVLQTNPTVVPWTPTPLPPLHGLPRNRIGTAMGHVMADITMQMISSIPQAIGDSLASGNYQLSYQYSVNGTTVTKTLHEPQPQPTVVQPVMPAPIPVQPARGPLRRWVMPRP
jgi:hypothetical protein